MKKIAILVPVIALMMLISVAPVMACKPDCFTFTMGQWAVSNPSVPGTTTVKNNVEYVVGSGTIDYRYSIPLDWSIANEKTTYSLNLASLTGSGVDMAVSSVEKDQSVYSFGGLGSYTYRGPTFEVGATVYTTGESFYGLLTHGSGIAEFTSGSFAGKLAFFTYAGCYFPDDTGISYWTFTLMN